MKHELFSAPFRLRNKRLQRSQSIYFECLMYFKSSIVVFVLLSAIVATLFLLSLLNAKTCWDVELISTIPILILGVLTKICKWRIEYFSHQLPW